MFYLRAHAHNGDVQHLSAQSFVDPAEQPAGALLLILQPDNRSLLVSDDVEHFALVEVCQGTTVVRSYASAGYMRKVQGLPPQEGMENRTKPDA